MTSTATSVVNPQTSSVANTSPAPPTYSKSFLTIYDLYMRYAPLTAIKTTRPTVILPTMTIQDLYTKFYKPPPAKAAPRIQEQLTQLSNHIAACTASILQGSKPPTSTSTSTPTSSITMNKGKSKSKSKDENTSKPPTNKPPVPTPTSKSIGTTAATGATTTGLARQEQFDTDSDKPSIDSFSSATVVPAPRPPGYNCNPVCDPRSPHRPMDPYIAYMKTADYKRRHG